MGYELYKFQNAPSWSKEEPTIVIEKGDDLWDEAYSNWIKGKPPTNDPKWKSCIIGVTRPK